jgi:curved DNA-binding protein CbpA
MGQAQSQLDARHVGIYTKLLAIQNPQTRLQTIDTLLGDASIVHSAKMAGVYGTILQYSAAVRHGSQPPLLPFETQHASSNQRQVLAPPQIQQRGAVTTSNQIISKSNVRDADPFQQVAKPRRSEKALIFFSACLRVLNVQEEMALTEEMLRNAYKKAAIRAHPDKGGSKDAFDAVTRAYAYLTDILKLVQGQQTRGTGAAANTAPSLETARTSRSAEAKSWEMPAEPVKLNPNNLNMNVFNQLFEQTRVPDPDEDGYGDWLKDEADSKGKGPKKGTKKFSEDFNREVFNRMFEEENYGRGETAIQKFQHPQEMILNVSYGVELGRDRPGDYTAAPGSKQQFTDLRAAYTRENTVSNQIQGVRVDNRDFNSYKAQRERAPDAYNPAELAALQSYEVQQKAREEQRRIRAAQEQITARDYFDRMKQLVITEK